MSNRGTSLNDIKVPSSILKDLPLSKLETLGDEEGSSFYEFFESLDLEDVRTKHLCWSESVG